MDLQQKRGVSDERDSKLIGSTSSTGREIPVIGLSWLSRTSRQSCSIFLTANGLPRHVLCIHLTDKLDAPIAILRTIARWQNVFLCGHRPSVELAST